MPYFKNEYINLLFLHIPKTGGTSLEKYLSKKYWIDLNVKSLYSEDRRETILGLGCGERQNTLPHDIYSYSCDKNKNVDITSLQHLTFCTIYKYNNLFNVDFIHNLKIITIVRNPYERIISDLFWFELITLNSSKEDTYIILKNYIFSNTFDNHNICQYLFLLDINNCILKDVTIFKTENLKTDMHNYGYNDCYLHENKNPFYYNYLNYLNVNSIELINDYYDLDFKIFNYNKIQINPFITK